MTLVLPVTDVFPFSLTVIYLDKSFYDKTPLFIFLTPKNSILAIVALAYLLTMREYV